MTMKTRTASRFVWYDLESADPDRVLAFYGDVLGWRPEPHPAGPMRYWTWMRDGTAMGGIGEFTEEARSRGGRPGWKGYVVSTDVDADVERVVALGGRVRMPAHTLETVGRMAVVEDPHGAPFALFAPDMSAMSAATNPAPKGRFAWHDLRTPDPAAAWAFYREMFGWTETRRVPMGEEPYRIFAADDLELGGIMKAASGEAARWIYTVRVGDIEEAARRVRAGGGEVAGAILDVPGGRAVYCADPEAATFGLYEANEEEEA